jgi:hypothetical protein
MTFTQLTAMFLESVDSLGIVFFLPTTGRPTTFPPLPKSMQNHKFWHTGFIYKGTTYECLNNGKSISEIATERIKNSAFNEVQFIVTHVNVPKMLNELTSGTDCATYVARTLGFSKTERHEKDPKYYPDTIHAKLINASNVHTGTTTLAKKIKELTY